MDYKHRLQEIAAFLKPYQRIWQNEIMLLYPEPLADYPKSWVDELAAITDKADVIRLEKKEVSQLIQGKDLLAYYAEIERLCTMEPIPKLPHMPENAFTFLHMIPKKQHEIRRLAPLINAEYHKWGVSKVVDIGGGIGLLAQTINNQYQLNVLSVDMDPVMQETGAQRHEKNAPNPLQKVKYFPVKVSAEEVQFTKLLDESSMTLGLHTCGELANHQIKASADKKIKSIINFGCCYQRLVAEADQNISQYASSLPQKLVMNKFALTLAARAHRRMSEKDYNLKLKVKLYRYAMHILLHDKFGLHELVTLGNTSPKQYDLSFGEYAQDQLSRINLPLKSIEELNSFYDRADLRDLVWRMIAAGLIRNALGRLLELYLLLDRVIYLEERNYQVKLLECFDESTSPRNLGIVARRE